jgi:ABC-type bacteriocin/lantibiotic exporter with double-glycine peptidase domain
MDALLYLTPAPLAFMVFGLASIWASSVGFASVAMGALLSSVCLLFFVERFTLPKWNDAVERRELQANLFANTFIGSSTAIECAIEACETAGI